MDTRVMDRPAVVHDKDFIMIYHGLDKDLCSAVIDLFNQDDNKCRGKIGRSGADSHFEEIKNSWDLEIPHEGPWRDVFQKIHPNIQACVSDYLSRSPILKSFPLQATGYKIQMYHRQQGYFRWHADAVGKNARDRVAAMILYLNDVEKGGETEFFHQGIKFSPRTGNLLMFPTGWNYMHCGHVPESSDKYIISSFVKINDRSG
jgi:hypothetical protein